MGVGFGPLVLRRFKGGERKKIMLLSLQPETMEAAGRLLWRICVQPNPLSPIEESLRALYYREHQDSGAWAHYSGTTGAGNPIVSFDRVPIRAD